MSENAILAKLQATLSANRYAHSVGVAETARDLARLHNADPEKAYLAGFLHDCSKYLQGADMLEKALSLGIEANGLERAEPHLLHAKVSARLAQDEYAIDDPQILCAIERHIYGAPDMALLDIMVNLADYTEPGRHFPDVDSIREISKEDPRRALLEGFRGTMIMLLQKNRRIHPGMIETYNALIAQTENLHSSEKAL